MTTERYTDAITLGDLRAGLCVSARPRDPACADSAPLWEEIGLPDDTPVEVLRERWTPLAACLLAVADGRGPRVGAVAWVEYGLGTAVLRGADLRGAYLPCANLRSADLRGANLIGAYLPCANLIDAYLSGADLRGAVLRGADLSSAYLTEANLRGANLVSTILTGAYLRGANLTGADLRAADLNGANLVGANLRDARALSAPAGWILVNGRLRREGGGPPC